MGTGRLGGYGGRIGNFSVLPFSQRSKKSVLPFSQGYCLGEEMIGVGDNVSKDIM